VFYSVSQSLKCKAEHLAADRYIRWQYRFVDCTVYPFKVEHCFWMVGAYNKVTMYNIYNMAFTKPDLHVSNNPMSTLL